MPMLLDIRNLPEGISEQEFVVAREALHLAYEDWSPAGDLQVFAKLTKLRDQVVFNGSLIVGLNLTCARCAEPFQREVRSDLLFVLAFLRGGGSLPEQPDTEDFYVLPAGVLEYDFSELVRERIILSVEMQPLCREECRGLCPHCGQNLNEGQCACTPAHPDDLWSPLKKLFEEER